ncbi:glycosyltransferase family 2 protein [Paludibacter sp. 221]|uniref:glycosyltransferase family 2 protein n=1 Tax=Paludibacter sp. 221 TaxID=2302939 RepID=UPI0013D6AC34|nr:glycosyltransferase family 2 protein [Paludibacter sp. 221]NDV47430.1 glycosyltransferase family 2 protein [Paludibacter sp. 221]
MNISIIIITWNQLPVLQTSLTSLEETMQRKDVELIVVDNGSKDNTIEFLNTKYPEIKTIGLSENKGVAFARNRGLEIATGKYLFILDNDTVVSKEAIEGMESFMDNHPEAGMCGVKLVDGNGNVQESGRKYPGLKEKVANILKGKEYRYSYSEETRSNVFEPVYLIGACQFVRREAYEQVGTIDEHIFYGPEDADFCIRIKNAGWHIYYLPQYSITHLCQRMTNKKLFSKMALKHTLALFYFYRKHKRFF